MIKRFYREALNSKFIRSVATLTSGKAAARVVAIIAIPFITRFFQPEEFGVASLFLAVVMVIATVANFGFDYAILLPKKEQEARALAKLALICSGATSTALLLVICVLEFSDSTPGWLVQLGSWVFLMPLGILLLGMTSIVMALSTRCKSFKNMAVADVTEATTVSGLRLLAGFLGFGVAGLIISLLLGAFLKLAIVYRGISRLTADASKDIELTTRRLISEYRQFPLYTMPTRLLNVFGQQLPTIALAAIYGPMFAGLYAMGNRLLNLPVRLLADSLRLAYVKKAAELHEQGAGIFLPLVKVTIGLALVSTAIYTPVYFFGEWLFSFALGENWSEAGVYAEIMSPMLFIMFFRAPSSATYVVLRRQHILLQIHIISMAVFVGVFVYARTLGLEVVEALQLYSWAGVVSSLLVISTALALAFRSAAKP